MRKVLIPAHIAVFQMVWNLLKVARCSLPLTCSQVDTKQYMVWCQWCAKDAHEVCLSVYLVNSLSTLGQCAKLYSSSATDNATTDFCRYYCCTFTSRSKTRNPEGCRCRSYAVDLGYECACRISSYTARSWFVVELAVSRAWAYQDSAVL
jgi:hypothetical protein